MARTLNMTYVPSQKRWTKWYRGKVFSVSCKQLGTSPGKEASWLAANSWWTAKQAELDAQEQQAKPDPKWTAIVTGLEASGVQVQSRADLFQGLAEILSRAEVPQAFINAVLGEQRTKQIDNTINGLFGTVEASRQVGEQVESWLSVLRASVQAGNFKPGRFASYKTHIGKFRNWLGNDTAIDALTSAKVEEFWAYLAGQVSEKKAAPAYARLSLMTATQFIEHLADKGLIPLPGNLRNRRFRFADAPKEVITFTDDEVKALLAEAASYSERTLLYILLALNCGMYQADISDIGADEVDWQAGTITRRRSKRRAKGGPKTRYKLWPETLALLKKYRATATVLNWNGQPRVLLTDRGGVLSEERLEGNSTARKDTIAEAFKRVRNRVGIEGKTLKNLRKTASTALCRHPQYKFYHKYFLAQSPKDVADRHYIIPNDTEFFAALDWLREQWL